MSPLFTGMSFYFWSITNDIISSIPNAKTSFDHKFIFMEKGLLSTWNCRVNRTNIQNVRHSNGVGLNEKVVVWGSVRKKVMSHTQIFLTCVFFFGCQLFENYFIKITLIKPIKHELHLNFFSGRCCVNLASTSPSDLPYYV